MVFTSSKKKRAFEFTGRASRSEYWYYMLYNTLFFVSAIFFDSVLFKKYNVFGNYISYELFTFGYIVFTLFPTISVTTRRVHDSNSKSLSIYILIGLLLAQFIFSNIATKDFSSIIMIIQVLKYIIAIWVFILLLRRTYPANNIYGEPALGGPMSPIIFSEKVKNGLLIYILSLFIIITTYNIYIKFSVNNGSNHLKLFEFLWFFMRYNFIIMAYFISPKKLRNPIIIIIVFVTAISILLSIRF